MFKNTRLSQKSYFKQNIKNKTLIFSRLIFVKLLKFDFLDNFIISGKDGLTINKEATLFGQLLCYKYIKNGISKIFVVTFQKNSPYNFSDFSLLKAYL